jgi:protein-S-isoprenylcysteine O-methyltransferase Ste14
MAGRAASAIQSTTVRLYPRRLLRPDITRPWVWKDEPARVPAPAYDLADALGRIIIIALFSLFAARFGADFLRTGRFTGLLLLANELLVVALTVLRRSAIVVDRSWRARLVTAMSLAGPPLLMPVTAGALVADAVTASISAAGLLVSVVGKLSLGRSFGLMPANRGIVCSGLYRVLRHPIYAGYLATHVALLAAHPSLWNVVALAIADAALLVRAVIEERTLARDPHYVSYLATVRWRVCPGLF